MRLIGARSVVADREAIDFAVTSATSCRKVSRTETSDAHPKPFFEIELGLARVDEAVFALRVLMAKLTVAFHRRSTVGAGLDEDNTIEDAVVVLAWASSASITSH